MTDGEDLDGGITAGSLPRCRQVCVETTERLAEAAAATTVAVSHFQSAANAPAVRPKRCFNSTIMWRSYASILHVRAQLRGRFNRQITAWTREKHPKAALAQDNWFTFSTEHIWLPEMPSQAPVSIKWNTIHKMSIRAGLPGGRREENRGVTAPLYCLHVWG